MSLRGGNPISKKMSRNRIIIIILSISALIIFSLLTCKKTKVFNIGIVNINPGLESVVDGFKSGMAKFGFIEGKNIIYINKGTLNSAEQADAALKDLVVKDVDLILAITTPVAQKAQKAVEGTKIPVVFAPVFFAVESGLVKSMTNPGGNLTGIQIGGSTAKALEWHKTVVHGSKHIFVPYITDAKATEQSLSELKKAAATLGIELIVAGVSNFDELKVTLKNIPRKADAIWLLNSPFLVSNVNLYVEAAIKHKLPLSSGTSQYNSGVMVSYGQDPFRTGEQASRLVHNIFEGASPADLPVEISDFFLGINLQTANAVGIKVPDEVLQQADGIVR